MKSSWLPFASLVVGLAVATGISCYDPLIVDGTLQCAGDRCPRGFRCWDGRCWQHPDGSTPSEGGAGGAVGPHDASPSEAAFSDGGADRPDASASGGGGMGEGGTTVGGAGGLQGSGGTSGGAGGMPGTGGRGGTNGAGGSNGAGGDGGIGGRGGATGTGGTPGTGGAPGTGGTPGTPGTGGRMGIGGTPGTGGRMGTGGTPGTGGTMGTGGTPGTGGTRGTGGTPAGTGGAPQVGLPLGASCDVGSDCHSTFCTDGVCCNEACGSQCRACDIGMDGVCRTVTSGPPHGTTRSACPGSPDCQSQCDGTSPTECGPAPSGKSCQCLLSLSIGTCSSQGQCQTLLGGLLQVCD